MVHETNSRELVLGDTSVIVREMTVQQVRAWLQDITLSHEFDFVSEWLIEGVSIADIKRMCTLNDEQINALQPSQLDKVATTCKELNPHFFGLLARARALDQSKG